MPVPANPIAAATHPDPYAYYVTLAAEYPIAFNHALGMWVAASAETVEAVLTDPRCRVRPSHEPVPEAIRWTALGDNYRRWARMNDGPDHTAAKRAVSAALASLDPHEVELRSRTWAAHLLGTRPLVMGLPLTLPTFVIGSLLGIRDDYLANTAIFVDHVVRWLAGRRDIIEIEVGVEPETLGDMAASDLRMTISWQLRQDEQAGRATLLTGLARQMRAAGIDAPETVEANAIGFLFQAYEATAGLIGNTLVTLQRQPDLRAQLANAPARVEQIVAQVAVADPAIQNTRRHVAEDGIIAGQPMHTGETIQVILAEANHDPAAQAQPIRLDAARAGRRGYSFGAGPHACPGAALAQTIARASIAAILAYRDDRWLIPEPPGYLSSVNARVPAFTEEFP